MEIGGPLKFMAVFSRIKVTFLGGIQNVFMLNSINGE